MRSAGLGLEGNHGELTDDELEQVTGGETKVLYDIRVAGMRVRATYDTETGDSRTCVTTASYGACKVTSPA